jgi:hypothetical protein
MLVALAEDAVAAICELSGRISASPVRSAWRLRAAWSGYARALRLQGIEIDDIDVFSWGCGVLLPGRSRRATVADEFGSFDPWLGSLSSTDKAGWKDALPFTPVLTEELPRLFRSLDLLRQYALRTDGLEVWLALPMLIHRQGLGHAPLPCLVAGSKAFRLRTAVPAATIRVAFKSLATSAQQSLDAVDRMEFAYRAALRAIANEYRPGKLPALLALSLSTSLLSPAQVATALDLTVAGAGKLLDRACSLGLVVEISGRRSWKAYLTPDLAIELGFSKVPLGRPRKEPPFPAETNVLSDVIDSFDREMAEIDARLAQISASH